MKLSLILLTIFLSTHGHSGLISSNKVRIECNYLQNPFNLENPLKESNIRVELKPRLGSNGEIIVDGKNEIIKIFSKTKRSPLSFIDCADGYILGSDGEVVEVDQSGIPTENLLYQCRNKGPTDSIMYYQWEAFDRVFDEQGEPKSPDSSLVSPAQFRAITNPGCIKENKDYYTCTQTSYTSSIALKNDPPCPEKPKVCEGNEWAEK